MAEIELAHLNILHYVMVMDLRFSVCLFCFSRIVGLRDQSSRLMTKPSFVLFARVSHFTNFQAESFLYDH